MNARTQFRKAIVNLLRGWEGGTTPQPKRWPTFASYHVYDTLLGEYHHHQKGSVAIGVYALKEEADISNSNINAAHRMLTLGIEISARADGEYDVETDAELVAMLDIVEQQCLNALFTTQPAYAPLKQKVAQFRADFKDLSITTGFQDLQGGNHRVGIRHLEFRVKYQACVETTDPTAWPQLETLATTFPTLNNLTIQD